MSATDHVLYQVFALFCVSIDNTGYCSEYFLI